MTATQPTNSLAVVTNDALPIARQVFGDERMSLIRALLPENFTPADIADVEQFALTCQRTHLDFFARPQQIYAIRRWDSKQRREVLTAQASIDSFRLVAARTREYQGQVGPFWCGPDEAWKDVWLSNEHPTAARVGVLRKGFREPIWSVAVWDRVKQEVDVYDGNRKTGQKKLAAFWEKMGAEMLAKTAECNALKRGFPNDTEGLELAAIDAEIKAGAAANAKRYDEIFGNEEDGTALDLPPRHALNAAGQTVDTDSGEMFPDEDYVPPRERDDLEDGAVQRVCAECGKEVLDQRGKPVNDSQVDLLKQRFGTVLCRPCRAKTPEAA